MIFREADRKRKRRRETKKKRETERKMERERQKRHILSGETPSQTDPAIPRQTLEGAQHPFFSRLSEALSHYY